MIAPDRATYPLGKPTNRSVDPAPPKPVPGRPNWFTLNGGEPYFVQPPVPLKPGWVWVAA